MPPPLLSPRPLTAPGTTSPVQPDWRLAMADIVFIALGLGAFVLFAAYAAQLRKV